MWPDKKRVETDLTEYQARIAKAEKKLLTLPAGWLPDYKIRKKTEQIRHAMEAEINHVQGLQQIVYTYLDKNPKLKIERKGW